MSTGNSNQLQASADPQKSQNSCYCVSNMFQITDNGRVFEYDLRYDPKYHDLLQENKDMFEA